METEEEKLQSRLLVVLERGRLSDIRRLLASGISPNFRQPLMKLAAHQLGYDEVADFLENRGEDEYRREIEKIWTTPLIHAENKECKPEVVRLLLEAGADPNDCDGLGMFPLMYSRHVQITRMLLEAGADIHAVEPQGRTALFFSPRADIVKLLLEKGANPHVKEQDGATPLMYACTPAVAQALMGAGADSAARTQDGRTVLHGATMFQHLPMVKFWLKQGINPDAVDNYGKTAYDYAEELDDVELMSLLDPDGGIVWF